MSLMSSVLVNAFVALVALPLYVRGFLDILFVHRPKKSPYAMPTTFGEKQEKGYLCDFTLLWAYRGGEKEAGKRNPLVMDSFSNEIYWY
ncbi:hypothetical protein BC830DRAFT_1135360 [Chytriomyces sp. MP71]|nr:hypothetical protein BC830DRAFT_1135360 [Chytriomyces sp. MP71]